MYYSCDLWVSVKPHKMGFLKDWTPGGCSWGQNYSEKALYTRTWYITPLPFILWPFVWLRWLCNFPICALLSEVPHLFQKLHIWLDLSYHWGMLNATHVMMFSFNFKGWKLLKWTANGPFCYLNLCIIPNKLEEVFYSQASF